MEVITDLKTCVICGFNGVTVMNLFNHIQEKHSVDLLSFCLKLITERRDGQLHSDNLHSSSQVPDLAKVLPEIHSQAIPKSLLAKGDTLQLSLEEKKSCKVFSDFTDSAEQRKRKRVRRYAHPVWSYFERIDRFDCVCLLCKGIVRSACSTNLSRHMKRHHPETALLMSRTREALLLSDTSDMEESMKMGDSDEKKKKRTMEDRVGLRRGRRQYMGGSDSQSQSVGLPVSARLSTEGNPSFRLDHDDDDNPERQHLSHPLHPHQHHHRHYHQFLQQEDNNGCCILPLVTLSSDSTTHCPTGTVVLKEKHSSEYSFKLQPTGETQSATFPDTCSRLDQQPYPEEEADLAETDSKLFTKKIMSTTISGAIGYLGSAAPNPAALPLGTDLSVATVASASVTSSPQSTSLSLLYPSGAQFMNDGSSISPSSASTTTSNSSGIVLGGNGQIPQGPSPGSAAVLSCPVPLHPYSLAPVQPPVVTSTLTVDLSSPWCSFPTYPDIRIEQVPYDHDIPYTNIGNDPKIDQMKYDFVDLRAKQFEETRLYHKQQDIVNLSVKENGKLYEEKDDSISDSVASNVSDVATPPAKRGRPTENPCWSYFIRLDDQNVRCRLCTKVVKSACATNMTKHLERHHHQDYQHLIIQIKQYRCRTQKGLHMNQNADQSSVNPNILTAVNPIKTELFNDVYNTGFEQNEHVFRNFGEYDPNDQNSWQRTQWGGVNQWQTNTQDISPPHGEQDPSMSRGQGVALQTMPHIASGWNHTPSAAATNPTRTGEKVYLKRNRKTEHPVWEYFKRTADGNAQCTICAGIVKSPCSSNFMRHLMRHHSTEYNNVYVKWVEKRGPNKF